MIQIDPALRPRQLRHTSLDAAEDRALQRALEMSRKLAEQEERNRRESEFNTKGGKGRSWLDKRKANALKQKKEQEMEEKEEEGDIDVVGDNQEEKIGHVDSCPESPINKKKRTSEIDQLVDQHWNECWTNEGMCCFISINSNYI